MSEHDTFRSNQIREGQIDRNTALALVQEENRPRYETLSWYLSAINLDFEEVILKINSAKKLYSNEYNNVHKLYIYTVHVYDISHFLVNYLRI